MTPTSPLGQLQAQVDAWAAEHWGGEYWPPLANLARLVEEVGEAARLINQQHGPKRVKDTETHPELAVELGDILFTLLALGNSLDIDLQAGFDDALRKYQRRDESGGPDP